MNKSHPKDTLVTKSEVWATMQPAKCKEDLDAVISLFRDRKTAEIFRQPGEYIESWGFIKTWGHFQPCGVDDTHRTPMSKPYSTFKEAVERIQQAWNDWSEKPEWELYKEFIIVERSPEGVEQIWVPAENENHDWIKIEDREASEEYLDTMVDEETGEPSPHTGGTI